MRLSLSVAQRGVAGTDVVVDTEDDATVGALRAALATAVGEQATGIWVGTSRLDETATIAATPLLRDGAVVALSDLDVAALPAPSQRGWQLHVVGGPDAGIVVALPVGSHELGRETGLGITDPATSRRHAVIRVHAGGATLADLGSANGTTLDGVAVPVDGVDGPVAIEPGQLIGIGDNLLAVAVAPTADAPVHAGPAGTVAFSRPPRLRAAQRQASVALPTAPERPAARKIPVIAVVTPMLLGIVMALVIRQPMYLMFALMSPAMAIGNTVSERRSSGKDHRAKVAAYGDELDSAQQRLVQALREETDARRNDAPDPAAVWLTAVLPTRRLWERRRTDTDALVLRVGLVDAPARVTVEAGRPSLSAPSTAEARTVYAVPATVSLRDAGVLGVAGPRAQVEGLVRWWVLQLAVHHAPRDVSLTLLSPRSAAGWSWLRWLPHARPADPDLAVASVGNDAETTAARIAELAALVKARRDGARSAGRVDRAFFPARVVLLDGARTLRALPGLAQILQDGPEVGVFAVCIDDEERFLPEECAATVVVAATDPSRADVKVSGSEPVTGVLVDIVADAIVAAAARALAPVRDVTRDEDESALPDSVRLLDVLGLEPPTVDGVRARWQLSGGGTTTFTIGSTADGPMSLDLRRDGPHGLMAGTTGAGKSELLQTVIASLAVVNRPDALNFVLVDYKGGSAFKDCVALPHTVGMVTDLDAHLVERALTSLGAELRRREHELARVGVKDLDDYLALKAKDPSVPPLPRLLLVIDEFASMARELPDFVTGLVNIAQRGRSLGIHLLLATQRPSGVVSQEIRANTNLRISLRVTDTADSQDVIDAADAARIPKSAPGRGYARLGHAALVAFQAGRIGGRRPGERAAVVRAPYVAPVGWPQLGYPPPAPRADSVAESDDVGNTDLSMLVRAICAAAASESVPEQRRPWLPALPAAVLLAELAPVAGVADLAAAPWGRTDLPAAQQQRTAAFDLATDGHLLALGAPRSGRSQLLRTLAGSLASTLSTADVHLYGIDCGNGALLPLTALPHCGAVVSRTQVERASRLLSRLATELERRQGLLARHGYADITEQRRGATAEDRLPHLVVLVDRWEGFTTTLGEVDGGRLTDTVMTLMREGASAGIHLVITGDRQLGSGRMGSLTESKLVFRLADRSDYSLVGLNARQLPDDIPPGRAFAAETMAETHVALLVADDSGQAQAAALAAIGAAATSRDAEVPRTLRPFRVDELPARPSYDDARALWPLNAPATFAAVGLGGDELVAVGPDLADGVPAFVVAGPGKSGRSSALAVMARSLLDGGARVAIGAPKASPLREYDGRPGVIGVVTDAAADAATWAALLGGDGPLVVVLDDAELLKESAAGELFRAVMKGAGPATALVLGGNADGICAGLSNWQVEAKRARRGLLLSPQNPGDGDLLGIRLPRSAVGQPVQPGRGVLHLGDGAPMVVAVPTP